MNPAARERDRQTDRQTDRQRQKQRQRKTETARETETDRDRDIDRKTERERERETERFVNSRTALRLSSADSVISQFISDVCKRTRHYRHHETVRVSGVRFSHGKAYMMQYRCQG